MTSDKLEMRNADALSDEHVMELTQGRIILRRWSWAISVAVILLVHSPFLYKVGLRLWERPHYQFFPLILAAFAWLVSLRMPLIQWPQEPAFSVRHGLYLTVAGLLFAVSVRTGSAWLGLISCLATLWTSVWYFGGSSAANELRGPFCLLGLLIPLPMDLDLRLIVDLQMVATKIASAALEWVSVWHIVSGVLVQTSEKAYLVEEACSGIHSLYSAVAAMLCFSIYLRYGTIRTLLVLAFTFLWVVVANGLRVFLLVYCETRYDLPLDSGWRHEALGIGTYVFAILSCLSTDQLMRFFVPRDSESATRVRTEFLWHVASPIIAMTGRLLDQPRLSGRLAVLIPSILFAVVFVGFAGITFGQTLLSSSFAEPVPESETQYIGNLHERLTAKSLPESIDGWKLTDFRNLERAPTDVFGGHSSQWFFTGYGLDVIVSLDGYYPGRHDLSRCYRAIGWNVEDANTRVQQPAKVPTTPVMHEQLNLFRDTNQFGLVFFSAFDSGLTPITPPQPKSSGSIWKTLKDRIADDAESQQTGPPVIPPVFQVQLLVETKRELMDHEEKVLLNLFARLRSELIDTLAAEN